MRRLGVEEELLVVEEESGVPAAVAGTLLGSVESGSTGPPAGGRPGGEVGAELQQQQIEIDPRPAATLAELRDQLRGGRQRADELAKLTGARIAALATSPVPVTPRTTPT